MTWPTTEPGTGAPHRDNVHDLHPPDPLYVDVAAVLDGRVEAPQTAAGGVRSDGLRLLYPGAVNVLLGPPEAGKTLVAGAMAADEIFKGGRVLWVDLDHNGAPAILTRLSQYGIPRETLTNPAEFRLAVPDEADHVRDVVSDARVWTPTLAVIDSVGELLPLFDANSNDADDYTRVNREILAALAATGAATLAIDHEAKNTDSARYGATGSAAKKRTVDGALLRVTNIAPFTPGVGGEAVLTIVKDRHGYLRAHAVGTGEPKITSFNVTSKPDTMHYTFTVPPKPGLFTAPIDDVAALAALTPPPRSVRDVMARLSWGRPRSQEALRAWRSQADEQAEEVYPDVLL